MVLTAGRPGLLNIIIIKSKFKTPHTSLNERTLHWTMRTRKLSKWRRLESHPSKVFIFTFIAHIYACKADEEEYQDLAEVPRHMFKSILFLGCLGTCCLLGWRPILPRRIFGGALLLWLFQDVNIQFQVHIYLYLIMIHGLSIHLLATECIQFLISTFFLLGEAEDRMEAYEPDEARCFVILTVFQCI